MTNYSFKKSTWGNPLTIPGIEAVDIHSLSLCEEPAVIVTEGQVTRNITKRYNGDGYTQKMNIKKFERIIRRTEGSS